MRVAVLGLGEAGFLYAAGLAARGATVVAFDPVVAAPPPGVERADDPAGAVRNADVVASIVGAAAAPGVAREVLPALAAGAVYADMNTGAPADKRALADQASAAGALFADVAIMAPVPRAAELTPLLVSGSGAARLAELWGGLGLPVTPVGDDAGAAAGLKLVRSVFMKGLAAVVLESVEAGERLGAGDWVRAELAGELGPDGAELVERLLTGTRRHAARREHEMRDARSLLTELGARSWMTDGTLAWLRAVAADEA